MMRIKLLNIFLVLFAWSALATAQNVYPVDSKFNGYRQNTISVMAASGNTLWIGPSLDYNVDNDIDWLAPADLDSITETFSRAFSISIKNNNIVAGLGQNLDSNGEIVPSGYGYYISDDNGEHWKFSAFPKDANPGSDCNNDAGVYDGSCDLEFQYGGKKYFRVRNTVKQQSPPYAVSQYNNFIFSASWASGLLRSPDFGDTWEKVILPPMSEDTLTPHNQYRWISQYKGQNIERYDPRTDYNLTGFGALVDSKGRTWFGSAGGVNISYDAISAPVDSISWRHIYFNNSRKGLSGNWVVTIKEDTSTGHIWMTNWVNNAQAGERYGIVSTSDGGITFQQYLLGQKINDIDFKDGVIYAAGEKGLFISKDAGNTWTKMGRIESANAFIKDDAEYFAVAVTNKRVWIGTSDGIISTDDQGKTWEISRVDYPLSGGNKYVADTKSVDSYAYPNPFSPKLHGIARIKYELKSDGAVHIRIFDFGMNLVREFENSDYSKGTYEAVWDGLDGYGRTVSNGVYFYSIENAGTTINGKILVIE